MTHTNGSRDRLDRIERILEATALRAEANARAIEADRITLREGIRDVVSVIANLAEQQEVARQEAAAERAAMKERQAESDQRFETMLAEMRADRQRNIQDHEEFRQAIRALLERE